MALALNNLKKRVDMPLNEETKPETNQLQPEQRTFLVAVQAMSEMNRISQD